MRKLERAAVRGAENATYGYDWRNQPTRTNDDVSRTRVTYDGLGRPVYRETETAYSSEAVTTSFFGGAQLGSVSTLHGASSSVWGVFGQLAGIDSEVTGEARWALLDRLGSVVAEAGGIAGVTGADIRELASYTEFGLPSYETGGFTSPYGFTGELQDAGTGVVAFGSRSYDAASGTWMAPDAWPGLLVAPQSLNRYAYVLGDPVTFVDVGGFAASTPNASGAANHYDYSGSAWKPILNPPSKASVPNVSGATNHYDWNGTGWRAVLTPELESMREARHPDSARTCTSLSPSSGCFPNGFRDMDYWEQHMKDIGDRVDQSFGGIAGRVDTSVALAKAQLEETIRRVQAGFSTPQTFGWGIELCLYICLGYDSNNHLTLGLGTKGGAAFSLGYSAIPAGESSLNLTCSSGWMYSGASISQDPFVSPVYGAQLGGIFGCAGTISIAL